MRSGVRMTENGDKGECIGLGHGLPTVRELRESNRGEILSDPRTFGRVPVHSLSSIALSGALASTDQGLGPAWQAIESSTSQSVDWFPSGVPVVLADVEGGEGAVSDTRMRVDGDRLLIRVVGLGGEP